MPLREALATVVAPASVVPEGSPRRRWRVRSYVLERREFNAIRMRLPRAVRRNVEVAPEGHVGLVAQAVVGEEGSLPLAVLYDTAPACVAADGAQRLERRLEEMLG